MKSYQDKFREKLIAAAYAISGREPTMTDDEFMAIVDEVVAENSSWCKCSVKWPHKDILDMHFKLGRVKERASIIAHVEEGRNKIAQYLHQAVHQHERPYTNAIHVFDRLLAHLRQSDGKEQNV